MTTMNDCKLEEDKKVLTAGAVLAIFITISYCRSSLIVFSHQYQGVLTLGSPVCTEKSSDSKPGSTAGGPRSTLILVRHDLLSTVESTQIFFPNHNEITRLALKLNRKSLKLNDLFYALSSKNILIENKKQDQHTLLFINLNS